MSGDDISAKDVYDAINGLRGEVRQDQATIWEEIKDSKKCQGKMKLDIRQNKNDIKKVELAHDITKNIILKHIENIKKHFNPFHEESIPAKAWRKKGEYTLYGTIIGGILFIVERALDYYNIGGS